MAAVPTVYPKWCFSRFTAAVRRCSRSALCGDNQRTSTAPSLLSTLAASQHQRRQCSALGAVVDRAGSSALPHTSAEASPSSSSSSRSSAASSSCSTNPFDVNQRVRDGCPTAALLVDTDGSARISLPFCATLVHDTVQAHLRALLVERLVAPLLASMGFEAETKSAEDDLIDAALLATTTLAVHDALHSIRHVAFSTMPPRLQHHSWTPLWAAYHEHLLRATPTRREAASDIQDTTEGSGEDRERVVAACCSPLPASTTEVTQVRSVEVHPLFGTAARGVFFYVSTRHDGAKAAEAAPTKGATMEGESSSSESSPSASQYAPAEARLASGAAGRDGVADSLLPSSPADGAAGGSYWECFRVDAFVPAHVQLQAAVRHLLRERRLCATHLLKRTRRPLTSAVHSTAPTSPSARPLWVIALVVPDHRVDAYTHFLDELERERATALAAVSGDDEILGGSSVQLLLFNSGTLVRVCHAV